MRGRGKVKMLAFTLALAFCWAVQWAGEARGEGAVFSAGETFHGNGNGALAGEMPGEDWSAIDDFLQKETEGPGPSITFTDLAGAIWRGDGEGVGSMILSLLWQFLFQEITQGGRLAGELLALGLVGAIFAGFSHIFTGGQISEAAFFMTYLLAFSTLAAAFFDSAAITLEVLGKQAEFMKVLMPSYFLAVAWVGGSASSIAWMELVLFLIGAVQWMYLHLLLPLTKIYMLLAMAGNMAGEDVLSKLTDLVQSVVCWGRRSLAGAVLGFQLIQGMVLPYADAVQSTGTQKILQAIPGAEAVTKTLFGSGVLIKNTMGAAAVVVLVVLSLVPLVKLAILLFLYQAVAAILQPIGDKRLVACISCVARGQKMLLELAASALLLFVITIALICAGTNIPYFLS